MAKLYTRQGDDGWTSLFNGTPVRKDDRRVTAYGTVDELNTQLGLVVYLMGADEPNRSADSQWKTMRDRLVQIQSELFILGAELATPTGPTPTGKHTNITVSETSRLERWIDDATASVPPLTRFILPGGDRVGSHLHVCRTVCRRAERHAVTLADKTPLNPQILIYLNRLSDLLFAWARLANHMAGTAETVWEAPQDPNTP